MKKFFKVLSVILVCGIVVASAVFMILTVSKMGSNAVIAVADNNNANIANNDVEDQNNYVANESQASDETTTAQAQQDENADDKADEAPVSSDSADVSKWTKSQIADFYVKAVKKTKAQGGNFSADHTRVLKASVTSCTGGSIVTKVVDKIVQAQLENTTETLNFVNGTAKRADGSSVTLAIFPPRDTECSLSESGIASASAKQDGDNIVLDITLVADEGTYDNPPKINAPAVGYFDFNSLDLNSNIKITGGQVQYPKSTITVTVNKDGVIVAEDGIVPIVITMQGSVMGITGELVIEGDCVETWDFK